ncbi:MAG: hypothetical protein ACF8LK_00470 [Phycisphaerales bacterium JB041]
MAGTPTQESHDDATDPGPMGHLRAFLGDASVECPSCRYSLAGLSSATCPECGWQITLRLDDGADAREVVRVARMVAVLGLVISVPTVLQYSFYLISYGTLGGASFWLLYMCVYLVLGFYSGSTLLALRGRQRARAVRALVRAARRRARIIAWFSCVCVVVPRIIQGVLFGLF